MNPARWEWSCPRQGCRKEIASYTSERGMRILAEEHILQHMREDREEREKQKQTTTAMEVFKPRNYNVLVLTPIDLGFLRTRGIAIDDQIELDLASVYKPSKTNLDQARWAKILNSAWELIPPGEDSGS